MLGIPLKYIARHPIAALTDLAVEPGELWTTIRDNYAARHEQDRPQCPYETDTRWGQKLHESLGMPWPCCAASEFTRLWCEVIREIEAQGIRAGPMSFQGWNDGDAGLARAIWCLIRHLQPENVVETGVAHGVTSRIVLEAMERNGRGHLSSIDLPPLDRSWRSHVGLAVGNRFADRWTFLSGSSRRILPGLLQRLGSIDVFIHDSLHTERNMLFEMGQAWAALKPGGAMVVDDIDANWAFRSFAEKIAHHQSLICEAEPIHPDERRFNQKGMFGTILKHTAAPALRRAVRA